jgi:hypothetical protein
MAFLTRLKFQICLFAFSILIASPVFAATESSPAVAAKKGTVTGKVMKKDGGPLSGGQIIFFNDAAGPPPEPGKYERTPEYVREIAQDGSFSVEVPAGKYYLGAVRRKSGETIGPPEDGDYVWRSTDKEGMPKAYSVTTGKPTDIGTVEAIFYRAENIAAGTAGTTVIEGLVLDSEGKPVPDAVVVAFTTPSVKSKPVFISNKTDKEGKYLLRVTAGTYYLRARNQFSSGPPEPGQIVGYYGEAGQEAIKVKDGQTMKNVDFKVILFPGRGPFSGSGPK